MGWTAGFIVEFLCRALPVLAFDLSTPLACDFKTHCLVQKVVDLKPGPGRLDYLCGRFTTEDHDGVDLRLPSIADMRAGVAVLAAADGTVVRLRDGEPDRTTDTQPISKGREAGNAVVIAHEDGFETQYSHLRQGSVRVQVGQAVVRGTPLGLVGLSGQTSFPHLHFAVRHHGHKIDPFTGQAIDGQCAHPTDAGLWTPEAAQALTPLALRVAGSGFVDHPPIADRARMGLDDTINWTSSSPALIFWVDVAHVEPGDLQTFVLHGPDGRLLSQAAAPIAQKALVWFAFHGKKRPPEGWALGRYTATYQLTRPGLPPVRIEATLSIGPQAPPKIIDRGSF